jgi:predicted nucleic acid-binding protein
VSPGPGHAQGFASALAGVGAGGNLVNDAHLAVLALEQRGSVVSYDSDFSRFAGLIWRRPEDLI